MAFLINKKINQQNCKDQKRLLVSKQACMAILGFTWIFSTTATALQPIADIAQTPLELTPTVESNIMILLDDSGSMDFEVMTADANSSGLFFAPNPDGSNYGSTDVTLAITQRPGCELVTAAFGGYAYGVATSSNQYVPSTSFGVDKSKCYVADEQAWRFRCASFNKLYYDPNQNYLPWPGLRSDGTPFPDAPIGAAPLDPYQANSDTINLETPDQTATGIDAFRYYNCHLDEASGNFVKDEIADADGGVDGAIVIGPGTPALEKQNFANWFTYYRSRHLRAKAVLGNFIVSQNNTRIGFAQLNVNSVSLEAEEMNQSYEDEGTKRDLLNKLYSSSPTQIASRFDTRYIQVARYLGCRSTSIFTSSVECPAEPAPAGTCQANHIVLASDGFQSGFRISTNGANLDVDSSSGEFTGGPFSDAPSTGIFPINISGLRTFSDVAMRFYRDDLHPSLPDEVVPTATDINRYPYTNSQPLEAEDKLHQHIKTHAITFDVPLQDSEQSMLQFPENESLSSQAPFKWLNPLESDVGLLQNLVHAVFSGRGEYLSATEPMTGSSNSSAQTLANTVAQGIGSTTPIAINTQGTSSDLVIYRTFYDSSSNSGDLTAQEIAINSDGTLNIESADNPVFEWSAAQQLDVLIDDGISIPQRNIITYSQLSNDGINFFYDDLDPAQQDDIKQPMSGTLDLGEDRVNYLRGGLADREGTSFSAGQFRVRPKVTSTGGGVVHHAKLGTIANAAPVFVGQPQAVGRFGGAWPNLDNETYFDFQSSNIGRNPSVLVAANDGMLHVFDAESGDERFAYVPSLVHENLSALTLPEYKHRFFVDSTPIVEDVYIRANGNDSHSWNTVVIGGLGAGGSGYYALNITDAAPLADPAQQVLWEFGPEDDPDAVIDISGNVQSDLGLSFAEPVIGMSNVVDGGQQRWVAIVGNGYNSTSVDGDAVIYVLFIDGGIDGDWSDSGDLVKITLGQNNESTPNGIADVRAIDKDGNGTIDHLYAGDLHGNLYAIDVSSDSTNDWLSNSSQYVLYKAEYFNVKQPITTRPIVVDYEAGTSDDVIVIFATGSYITRSDAIDTEFQTVYAVVDDFSGNRVFLSELNESTLSNQQIVDTSTNTTIDVRIIDEDSTPNGDKGWFIDFDVPPLGASAGSAAEFPGEKAVRALQVRSGILFVNTVIPQELSCDPSPGGFSLAVDPQTGTAGDEPIFDINNDSEFNDEDNINLGSNGGYKVIVGTRFDATPSDSTFYGDYRITQLSNTDIDAVLTNTAKTELIGRQAWREVEF